MANRPRGYGLTAEIKNKMAAKYDLEKEHEARIWIESVLGEPLIEVSIWIESVIGEPLIELKQNNSN